MFFCMVHNMSSNGGLLHHLYRDRDDMTQSWFRHLRKKLQVQYWKIPVQLFGYFIPLIFHYLQAGLKKQEMSRRVVSWVKETEVQMTYFEGFVWKGAADEEESIKEQFHLLVLYILNASPTERKNYWFEYNLDLEWFS